MTLSSALSLSAGAASLRLSQPFGEHMVLQQGQSLRLRGLAVPGADVKAMLAGVSAAAEADEQGRWELSLATPPAGGPYALTVEAGAESLSLQDLLCGEVWLASGQSNMEWELFKDAEAASELPKAEHPQIRLFSVARKLAAAQGGAIEGSWSVCTPETAKGFSAVAYHFGVELQAKLGVPVGLVAAPWSGTPGEAWAPRRAMEAAPALAPALARWDARPPEEKRMYLQGWDFELELKDLRLLRAGRGPKAVKLEGAEWYVGAAPGSKTEAKAARYSGNLPPGAWAGALLALAKGFAELDLSEVTGLEFQARGNSSYEAGLSQPSIQDGDIYGLPKFTPTKEWQEFKFDLKDLKQGGWGKRMPLTIDKIKGLNFSVRAPNQFPDQPGVLYDAMIAPLAPLGLRGALWYQGESNLGRAGEYGELLKALLSGWREGLGLPGLNFLVVQLPDYGPPAMQVINGWAPLRAAQATLLKVPGTGLAVTLGLGEGYDYHPRRKKPVGQRLAWEALGLAYGKGGFSGRGPELEQVERQGSGLKLSFKSAAGGLRAAEPKTVKGFEVAGADGKFVLAQARLEGSTVLLSAPGVSDPKALRYAWADNPLADLKDDKGLPALPFLREPLP